MGTIKTFLLMAGLMLLFMYTGELFGGHEGMKTAFWMAGGINIFAYFFSDKLVLSHYKAIEKAFFFINKGSMIRYEIFLL